jgi:hypothetical protein
MPREAPVRPDSGLIRPTAVTRLPHRILPQAWCWKGAASALPPFLSACPQWPQLRATAAHTLRRGKSRWDEIAEGWQTFGGLPPRRSARTGRHSWQAPPRGGSRPGQDVIALMQTTYRTIENSGTRDAAAVNERNFAAMAEQERTHGDTPDNGKPAGGGDSDRTQAAGKRHSWGSKGAAPRSAADSGGRDAETGGARGAAQQRRGPVSSSGTSGNRFGGASRGRDGARDGQRSSDGRGWVPAQG